MNGRKRRVIVDMRGLTLEAAVHPADVQDRDGAKLVIKKLAGRFPGLRLIWADGGYAGKLVKWAREEAGCALEIVRRPKGERGLRVYGSSQAVGSGADVGVAEQVSEDEQGLRKAD